MGMPIVQISKAVRLTEKEVEDILKDKKSNGMQSYEFYSKPANGTIQIPEQYKDKITSNVKVSLLKDDTSKFDREESNIRRRTDLLSPISIDTRGWNFNKEEANT